VSRPCPACNATDARPFAEKSSHRLVRCGRCATLYTSDVVRAGYEVYYNEGNLQLPEFLAKRFDAIVAGFASSRRTGRLLDVGFGAGGLLEAARRAGWTASGVEVSAAAVAQARERGIDAFHGTLAEARYEAGSFDVVVAAEIVEHLADVRPLLDEIARVLRPGGLFWATTPHGRGLSARILAASWSVVSPPFHVQLFSAAGVRQLLRDAGFERVSVSAEGANAYEIVRHLCRGRIAPRSRVGTAYAMNAFLEAKPGRRAVKRAINGVLSALRLGDSLKVSARKAAS
jgi:SAM-dependent methyltransferase